MFGSDYGEIEETTNGIVFNIEHFHVHDGEGIRTNVFLKGCNLHCPWCCNPESISPKYRLHFIKNSAPDVGSANCPQHCIEITGDGKSKRNQIVRGVLHVGRVKRCVRMVPESCLVIE